MKFLLICVLILQVLKLEALGYVPILFFGQRERATEKWVADVLTHVPLSGKVQEYITTMRMCYERILLKQRGNLLLSIRFK